jgi:hypothetical protein
MLVKAIKAKKERRSPGRLLKDLSEIKAVLDVETQLIKTLVRMAVARQIIGLQLSF